MAEDKKIFRLGCIFFTLAILCASILPITLKYFDLYYYLPSSECKRMVMAFSALSFICFLFSAKYHKKQLIVIVLGILIVVAASYIKF